MISVKVSRVAKVGTEPFHENGNELPFSLMDFWRWSVSDLLSNATRGRLAEFIVATALQIPLTTIRDEWAAWDLTTREGIRVEVKSAAYLQSWHQRGFSKISFLVRETRFWDAETNKQDEIAQRQADVYVFALLAHKDEPSLDPMDLKQWKFYVLPSIVLNQRKRSQNSISLMSLEKLCQAIPYGSIRSEVLSIVSDQLE